MKKVLVINPGSTSTKLGYYEDCVRILDETLDHEKNTLQKFETVAEQLEYRLAATKGWLTEHDIKVNELDAISSRGGLLRPLEGGSYSITDAMISDLLSSKYGEHASNLGAAIAQKLTEGNANVKCMITDPTCIDELNEYARMTGCTELPNISKFHALSQKYTARKTAEEQGVEYHSVNYIVAHMGGGITVGVHERGKVVHVNNGLDGTGPFSPERAGTLPRFQLIDMCFSGDYTREEIKKKLGSSSGIMGYLGTNDIRVVEKAAENGDKTAELYLEGMCYHIAREIAAGAAVLSGKCDGIILTGGIAYSKKTVEMIKNRVLFIAPVYVKPGSDENLALAEAAYRVLNGTELLKEY